MRAKNVRLLLCSLLIRAPEVDNWMIIELQGTLETKEDVSLEGKAIGDLHFDAKVGVWWQVVSPACRFAYTPVYSNYAPILPPPGLLRGISPPFQSRGWALANFAMPGGRAFANPGASPELLTPGFLSKNYYTEEFSGKTNRLAHLVGGWGWLGKAEIQLMDA